MSKNFEHISLSKGLRLRIGHEGRLYASISPSSGEFYIAPEVLSILCQIEELGQKLEINKISQNLNQSYKNIISNNPSSQECKTILMDLVAAGLVIQAQQTSSRYLQSDGFGDLWIQWAMISDSIRSLSYEKAIFKYIRKNSVVVDVGAGSGLLTGLCLKAGAEKVIAIEETQIAQKIIPLLNLLKLPTQKDKLTLLNLNSFDVQLPKEVTHVVSELFGNDPFTEGVIPTLRNIGQHFTKQPIYIPLKISVYFELIDIIEHPVKHRVLSLLSPKKESTNHSTENSLQKEFLMAARKNFKLNNISFSVEFNKSNFKRVSTPVELGQMPLNPPPVYSQIKYHPLHGKKNIKVIDEGECIVGLLWFRVYLTDSITISNHPQELDAAEHWSPLVLLRNKKINKNENLTFVHSLNEEETQLECSFL